ncbi:cytochrome P450 [Leptolyngbya sp. FACHB-261]|nr:cytochrome P450 [Leptolyngbya sp. FACHB-261]
MKLPDGPKTPPFLQTIEWIARPLEYLDERAQRYGDPFRVLSPHWPPILYFSNPAALQEILGSETERSERFDTSKGNLVLKPVVGEQSLTLLEGERHLRQRRLLMPPFHGERMRAYGELICAITTEVMSQCALGQPFTVRSVTQDISLKVILSTVFGLCEGARYEQLRQLLSQLVDGFASPLGSAVLFYRSLQQDLGAWSPWGRFLRRRQAIDQLLYAEIAERRAQSHTQSQSEREDILALLLAARDETGQPLSDVELRDELVTLLFAGHETTASALAWALYWIDYLPEVRDKLLVELDTLGPNAEPNAIARLPYLSAVCQETLRIYPIALNAFPRIVKRPMELMGYHLEPGTVLIASIYLAHQRPDTYPEPKQFKPERFLERQFSPYEYLPFGGGNRRCIGLAFAQFEMKLVLATMLSQWQLSLVQHQPLRPVRRGVTLAPPSSLQMVVKGKRPHLKSEQPEVSKK